MNLTTEGQPHSAIVSCLHCGFSWTYAVQRFGGQRGGQVTRLGTSTAEALQLCRSGAYNQWT